MCAVEHSAAEQCYFLLVQGWHEVCIPPHSTILKLPDTMPSQGWRPAHTAVLCCPAGPKQHRNSVSWHMPCWKGSLEQGYLRATAHSRPSMLNTSDTKALAWVTAVPLSDLEPTQGAKSAQPCLRAFTPT
jgi:hypothetical protein